MNLMVKIALALQLAGIIMHSMRCFYQFVK